MVRFSEVMLRAHFLAKARRVSTAGSNFKDANFSGSTYFNSAIGAVILMVPLSTPLMRKASDIVRTREKVFRTFLYRWMTSAGPLTDPQEKHEGLRQSTANADKVALMTTVYQAYSMFCLE